MQTVEKWPAVQRMLSIMPLCSLKGEKVEKGEEGSPGWAVAVVGRGGLVSGGPAATTVWPSLGVFSAFYILINPARKPFVILLFGDSFLLL